MAITAADIENLFTYHAPIGDQPQRYQRIRDAAKQLAQVIVDNTPASADQTAAIRKLRECVWIIESRKDAPVFASRLIAVGERDDQCLRAAVRAVNASIACSAASRSVGIPSRSACTASRSA